MHALGLALNLDRVAGLQLRLQLGDDLADVPRNAAEIAALHAGVDVEYRLDIGLVQIGRHAVALQRRHVAQEARYRRSVAGYRAINWSVRELAQRAHQTLRRLDRDEIGNPGFRVGPEIRRDLFRGTEAGVEVTGNGLHAK